MEPTHCFTGCMLAAVLGCVIVTLFACVLLRSLHRWYKRKRMFQKLAAMDEEVGLSEEELELDRRKRNLESGKICTYCRDCGEPAHNYRGHWLREGGVVTCEAFRLRRQERSDVEGARLESRGTRSAWTANMTELGPTAKASWREFPSASETSRSGSTTPGSFARSASSHASSMRRHRGEQLADSILGVSTRQSTARSLSANSSRTGIPQASASSADKQSCLSILCPCLKRRREDGCERFAHSAAQSTEVEDEDADWNRFREDPALRLKLARFLSVFQCGMSVHLYAAFSVMQQEMLAGRRRDKLILNKWRIRVTAKHVFGWLALLRSKRLSRDLARTTTIKWLLRKQQKIFVEWRAFVKGRQEMRLRVLGEERFSKVQKKKAIERGFKSQEDYETLPESLRPLGPSST